MVDFGVEAARLDAMRAVMIAAARQHSPDATPFAVMTALSLGVAVLLACVPASVADEMRRDLDRVRTDMENRLRLAMSEAAGHG